MNKFKFSQKMEIKMPKVEGKAETPKMRQAVRTALSKGAQKGSTYVSASLKKALDDSIDSSWAWNNGLARDIVDTGRLKDSLKIVTKFSQTKVGFEVQYNTPYAAYVHYGSVIQPYGNKNAASVVLPARPWVEAVFEGSYGQPKFDMLAPFDRGVKDAWTAQFG